MTEKNITVTVKTKNGSLVTVRGDEPEEFIERAQRAVALSMNDFVFALEELVTERDAVSTVLTAVGGEVINTQPVVPVSPNAAFAPVTPPVVAPTFAQAGRSCAHGAMTKRTGEGQWGPYKAYYCPTPKGTPDQCKPIYLKATDPEWNSF